MKATDASIACYDAVAGYQRGKGVAAQGLSDGLRTVATDTQSQFLVGNGLAGRNVEQRQVDPSLKRCDGGAGEYPLAYVVCHLFGIEVF